MRVDKAGAISALTDYRPLLWQNLILLFFNLTAPTRRKGASHWDAATITWHR